MLFILPSLAFALAPVGEIVLAPNAQLDTWEWCPARGLVAVKFQDQRPAAVYQLDLATRSATLLGSLDARSHEFAFSPDCSWLVTGQLVNGVNDATLWRLDGAPKNVAPRKVAGFGKTELPSGAMVVSSDGRSLLVGDNGGDVVMYAMGTPPVRRGAVAGTSMVMTVAFSPGGVLAGYYDGSVRSFVVGPDGALGAGVALFDADPASRKEGSLDLGTGRTVLPGGSRVWALLPHAGGALVLSERRWIVLIDGTSVPRVLASGLVEATKMARSPNGTRLAVVGGPGVVWSLGRDELTNRIPLDGLDTVGGYIAASDLAFVDEQTLLVGAYNSAALRVYTLP
ncbi:MAG: hypothetical protein V4850_31910 [Myxococcota bacterium]